MAVNTGALVCAMLCNKLEIKGERFHQYSLIKKYITKTSQAAIQITD